MKYDYKKLKSVEYKTKTLSGVYSNLFLLFDDNIRIFCDNVELKEFPIEYRVDNFRDVIKSAKIENWDKEYHLPPEQYVYDGLKWEIELEFEDGKLIKSCGENAYPANWLDVHNYLDKFYIDDEDDEYSISRIEFKYIRPLKNNKKIVEELVIDRKLGELTLKSNHQGNDNQIIFTIKNKNAIERLLDDIFEVGEQFEGKFESKTKTTYEIKIDYINGNTEKFINKYSRFGIPERWYDVLETLRDYLRCDCDFEFLKESSIENIILDDEVIYLSVSFDEYSSQTYYYQTTDTSIEIGDTVIVPVGKDNHESLAYVDNIEIFDKINVPLPLNKTKSIIRKM